MIPADLSISTQLTVRYMWGKYTPRDWANGLTVKLLKKGNLNNSENWLGNTLLYMPSTVFCTASTDAAIDTGLRQKQAKLRKGGEGKSNRVWNEIPHFT